MVSVDGSDVGHWTGPCVTSAERTVDESTGRRTRVARLSPATASDDEDHDQHHYENHQEEKLDRAEIWHRGDRSRVSLPNAPVVYRRFRSPSPSPAGRSHVGSFGSVRRRPGRATVSGLRASRVGGK